ncbi:hypothetical protein BS50DRAFT_601498 [Corynespora cassiicola Philippines]|uniref:RING-type E3 ubiquitin transferase n=1 Tax=Corynespora cassiicola Philippines TaxID=1448308 RepID=A0A2T2NI63_CORCC|nr:hypothetical protein BS50DRAFT_601498 [Corynespora cassiicola Philippines]
MHPRPRGSSQSSPNQPAPAEGDHSAVGTGAPAEPPHHHPQLHGAVASHYLSQSPGTYGGQTWMDFLRENGAANSSGRRPSTHRMSSEDNAGPSSARYPPPVPPPNDSRNSDRKRRLTAGESPMRRPSGVRVHPGTAGHPGTDHLVPFDSMPASRPQRPPLPPLPPPPSFPPQNSMGPRRRESDIVLPQWQPDADVSHCPVCKSQFTFFYRKHHCRKCGRVVCSACSPHRITIPRQFIVHPPGDSNAGPSLEDIENDEDGSLSFFNINPALGGGEVVRVCNPCVPDPNYSPPPQYTSPPAATSRHSYHFSSSGRPSLPAPGPPRPHGHRTSQSVHDSAQSMSHGQSSRTRDPFSDRRVSFHNSTSVADLWPPTQPPQSRPHYDSHGDMYGRSNAYSSSHVHSSSEREANMFRRHFFPNTPPQQSQPPPRRQIAEEDECPVCGNELPPKGPNGEDSERVQHVDECVQLHSASPRPAAPTNQTSTSLPSQRTRGMSTAGNGEGASTGNRLIYAARGMVDYIATEKDCFDEDGDQAECIICFEEFEQGDRMSRLACWCKFHEACIKQWWETKGRGACPTHQLHE